MQERLKREVRFRSSRSSGAGGQHVNKVSTKVELLFNVDDSEVLTETEKETVFSKLKNRISNEGILSIACEETRSQSKNKEIAFDRFISLLEEALKPTKKRVPTKPSKSSVEKRLKNKKVQSEKKESRKFKDE